MLNYFFSVYSCPYGGSMLRWHKKCSKECTYEQWQIYSMECSYDHY